MHIGVTSFFRYFLGFENIINEFIYIVKIFQNNKNDLQ